MFLPFFPVLPAIPAQHRRRTRLQDLDARMSSFLSEKQRSDGTCAEVLDNVKATRSKIQQEMSSAR